MTFSSINAEHESEHDSKLYIVGCHMFYIGISQGRRNTHTIKRQSCISIWVILQEQLQSLSSKLQKIVLVKHSGTIYKTIICIANILHNHIEVVKF